MENRINATLYGGPICPTTLLVDGEYIMIHFFSIEYDLEFLQFTKT